MDSSKKEIRRIEVRDLLKKYGFSLKKAKKKADEFKNSDGQTIYFYWDQGEEIFMAINPNVPFDALMEIQGVEFSPFVDRPNGIRSGTAMTEFPGEYKGYRPNDPRSKVGRMFFIEKAGFHDFMSRLVSIFAGKTVSKIETPIDQPAGTADLSTSPDDSEEDAGTKDMDSDNAESQGYEQDPEMRSAVELYAESIAKEHYVSQGFRVRKFGKPFDLLCEKEGESIHVEVKGSRTKLDTVILTINEVSDAENADWQSDLFVVDQIVVERVGDKLVAGAGVARVIQKWVPAKEMLAPSQFKYRLPDESEWKFLK